MTDDYLFQDEKPTVKDGCEGCCFWEDWDGDVPCESCVRGLGAAHTANDMSCIFSSHHPDDLNDNYLDENATELQKRLIVLADYMMDFMWEVPIDLPLVMQKAAKEIGELRAKIKSYDEGERKHE